MERFFVALSDRTRLRLLNLIGEDEVCVYFFVEVLEETSRKSPGILLIFVRLELSRREEKGSGCIIGLPPLSILTRSEF